MGTAGPTLQVLQFDGPFLSVRKMTGLLCVNRLRREGRLDWSQAMPGACRSPYQGGKTYPPNDSARMDAMRKSCARKGGAFWTNTQQKEAAARDVIEFLNKSFGT